MFAATVEDAHGCVMPTHQYCERLPNSLFLEKIWPLVVAPDTSINETSVRMADFLEILFKLRSLSTAWKWLVETSAEWAAFRLAKNDTRGLVARGTSQGFALRRAVEEFENVLSLLTSTTMLSVPISHHALIAPFPDLSDKWLLILKSALEIARDGTLQIGAGDAHIYIPPLVGAIISKERIAVGNRLRRLPCVT